MADEKFTEEEAAQRRDRVLKRMLNTPPKPQKPEASPHDRPGRKGDRPRRARSQRKP
jgi:hypothetical protein